MTYIITLGGIREAIRRPPIPGTTRVLTDRLWPRGIRKADLNDIVWYRDASPEPALRKAYHDTVLTQDAFFCQYRKQLLTDIDCLAPLLRYARSGALQLLTATHDADTSYLKVLAQVLTETLTNEDEACRDKEPSSPVCYASMDLSRMK